MQPEDCGILLETPDPPTLPDEGIAAGWMLLALVVAVVVFDLWALHTKRRTLSQTVQKVSRGWWWVRVIGVVGLALVGWHVLWGFP